MLYFLCFLAPPLAVLLVGRPMTALLNCVFTIFFWIPGVIHALVVVADAKAQKRHKQLVKAIANQATR